MVVPTKKAMQTELSQGDYEAMLALASRRGLTIKEAARQAIQWWVGSQSDLATDSLFMLKPVRFKVKVRGDEVEALYDGR